MCFPFLSSNISQARHILFALPARPSLFCLSQGYICAWCKFTDFFSLFFLQRKLYLPQKFTHLHEEICRSKASPLNHKQHLHVLTCKTSKSMKQLFCGHKQVFWSSKYRYNKEGCSRSWKSQKGREMQASQDWNLNEIDGEKHWFSLVTAWSFQGLAYSAENPCPWQAVNGFQKDNSIYMQGAIEHQKEVISALSMWKYDWREQNSLLKR